NYTVSTSDYKTIFPTAKQIKSDLLSDVKNTVLIKETIDKPDVRITDDEVTGAVRRMVNDNKQDRKSTRLNSSHVSISYAVFCSRSHQHILCLSLPTRRSSDLNYTVSTSDYKTIFPTAKQIKSDLLSDVKNTVLIKETIDKPDVRITDDEVTGAVRRMVNDNK